VNNVTLEQQRRWLATETRPADDLLRRYRNAQNRAALVALLARVRGRSTALPTLAALLDGRRSSGGHVIGLHSVSIAAIVASEGRQGDFDRWFRPLRTDSWDRWRSVASAMLAGAALPPVELLLVVGQYAVRDGHHRISAAVVLGQRDVDAVVTVLEC
jgi:hypothetical protein